jgi:hypothetical protein
LESYNKLAATSDKIFNLFTTDNISKCNTFTAGRVETEFQRLFYQKLLTLIHVIGHQPGDQCLRLLLSDVSAVI